jgi:hypothetical protein
MSPQPDNSQPAADDPPPIMARDEHDQARRLFREVRKATRELQSVQAKIDAFSDGLDEKYDFRSRGYNLELDTGKFVRDPKTTGPRQVA